MLRCYRKVYFEYKDISICDDMRLIAEDDYEDCLWHVNFNNGIDIRKKIILFCNDSLFLEKRNEYDFWESKFSELYPDLNVYDAGAYCKLSNGNQLVSFSYFSKDAKGLSGRELMDKAGQIVILFNENNNLLKATKKFHCETSGDLGYPIFESITNNKVTMSCNSGDVGWHFKTTYELDFDTFDFRLVDEKVTEPQDYNNY